MGIKDIKNSICEKYIDSIEDSNLKNIFNMYLKLDDIEIEEISVFKEEEYRWDLYIEQLIIFKELMKDKGYFDAEETLIELIDFNNIKNPRIYYNVVEVVGECLWEVLKKE